MKEKSGVNIRVIYFSEFILISYILMGNISPLMLNIFDVVTIGFNFFLCSLFIGLTVEINQPGVHCSLQIQERTALRW